MVDFALLLNSVRKVVNIIKLSNIVNSIDSALEKNSFYDNSNFDNLLDKLTAELRMLETKNLLNSLSKDTKFVIDRFEEEFAVCENQTNRRMYNIPRSIVEPDAKEGSILMRCGDIYLINSSITKNL